MDRIRAAWSASQPLLPFLAILAVIGSNYAGSQSLRTYALGVAVVFCLFIIGDLARSFLDPDLNNVFMRGKDTPVTTLEIVVIILLALVYTSMILIIMTRLLGSRVWLYHPTMALCVLVAAFLFSCSVAWKNVRLWWGQGAEYEEDLKELKEEEARSQQSQMIAR